MGVRVIAAAALLAVAMHLINMLCFLSPHMRASLAQIPPGTPWLVTSVSIWLAPFLEEYLFRGVLGGLSA